MSFCPSCQNPIEILDQHKGTLFTCPHCSAVYFVDWNGVPEQPNNELEFRENSQDSNLDLEPIIESPQPNSGNPESHFEEVADFSNEALNVDQFVSETEPIESPEASNYDLSQSLDQIAIDESDPVTNQSNFSDVTQYANSNSLTGSITYTITIDGVETNTLIAQLREAMTDSRFGWDVDSLLDSLKKDRLILKSISPAKASVLISRIKYLPLKISWRQDVFSSL